MFSKFGEAIRLLLDNLGLFSAIVLTVWLPGNVLLNYLVFNVFSPDNLFGPARISMWIEGIFGPVYVGALIHALAQLERGQRPEYWAAMKVGFGMWGRLFVARFVAGLIVLLGLVALIVPGIVLAVRYAFLDQAVVLDGATTEGARTRSTELTAGVRWQIFGAAVLFFALFFVAAALVYEIPLLIPQLDVMATYIVIDCMLDVGFLVLQIVIFLYYWQQAKPPVSDAQATFEPPIQYG